MLVIFTDFFNLGGNDINLQQMKTNVIGNKLILLHYLQSFLENQGG